MRSDKDFDTWFLIRLCKFVLRCQGIDFNRLNSEPVLERYDNELAKNSRDNARIIALDKLGRLSIQHGNGPDSERGRASNL